MKKETMLDYLDKQLSKKLSDFDTAIDWDTRNHTIEVIVRLFGENQSGEAIDDAQGIVSEETIIEFEDGLLFYNNQKEGQFDAEDYLAVIPFEGKKGLKQSVLDGTLAYLNEVLIKGQEDLLDFLNDDGKETFELVWDEEEYNKYMTEAAGEDSYLPYPSY